MFLAAETISAQFDWQTHNPKSVMLVFDPYRTMLEGACGSHPLALRAYRLSAKFMKLYKKGTFTIESIRENEVSYKHIFEEIPISIRPAFPSAVGTLLARAAAEPALQSDRTVLDTTISPLIERSVSLLVDKFDHMTELQSRFALYQRHLASYRRRKVCRISIVSFVSLFLHSPLLVLLVGFLAGWSSSRTALRGRSLRSQGSWTRCC